MALYLRHGCLLALLALGGCAAMPASWTGKTEQVALAADNESALAVLTPPSGAKTDSGGFRMISAGVDGLLARVEIIDRARRSLDLQYYIFRGDQSGTLVAAALLRAADRGVRVRLVVDDGETIPGDEQILSLCAHPNIDVRIFNPFRYRGHLRLLRAGEFLFNKRRLDYRMHNKLLIADDVVALIGGRNIGDQYFQIDPNSQFGDDDVFVTGGAVPQLSQAFDEFWNSAMTVSARVADPKHASAAALERFKSTFSAAAPEDKNSDQTFSQRLRAEEPLHDILSGQSQLSWATFKLVHDSPDKREVTKGNESGSLIYVPMEDRARAVRSSMLVVSPYLVPTPSEMSLLEGEKSHGVQVKILTNSLASAPDLIAQAGYMHYRNTLLSDGVVLYEIRPALGNSRGSGQNRAISRHGNYALHAKIFIFDQDAVFIGSMNLDSRSKRLNTEIGLIIDSSDLASQAIKRFDALTSLDNAYQVSLRKSGSGEQLIWTTRLAQNDVELRKEPARSGWQRFKVRVLALAHIDREL
jgi:putative cardiolipin synthase